VALKLIAPERVGDPAFAERFTREARALAALSHPNIVTVFDFGQAGGYYYLLMEFVDGVNLRQAMRGGRFTPEQALAVVPPVCDALQYAHEHGIVHRDIKPENLLLDKSGRIKIADFGIARMLHVGEPGTVSEWVPGGSQGAGTPQYMAPEQLGASPAADHRADIYSLGVVLYELLTGQLPVRRLEPPSRKVQIDVRLDEIVMRALEQNPELRYQTAGELRSQLEMTTRSRAAAANIPANAPSVSVRSRSTPGLSWKSIVIALLVLMVASIWAMRRAYFARRSAEKAWQASEQLASEQLNSPEVDATRPANAAPSPLGGGLPEVTWTAGPVQELELSPTKGGTNCFANLERGQGLTPPAEVAAMTQRLYWWQQLQAPVDRWLRINGVSVFCSDEGATGLELIHGYYGFTRGLVLSGDLDTSLEGLDLSRIRRQLEEFVDDALIYQLSVRTQRGSQFSMPIPHRHLDQSHRPDYYCLFRTGLGRYGILQTRESEAKPGPIEVRYRLLQAETNGPALATDVDPFAIRPELRFLSWQDQWRLEGPVAARRPDGTSVGQELDRSCLGEVPPSGLDIGQTEFDKKTRFVHLWFSHPLFDGLSLQEVTLLDTNSQPLVLGAAGSMSAGHQGPSPRNGNRGWITYTVSPGVEGQVPERITVRLRYTFGLPNLPQKIPVDFSGGMALPGGGQLNGVGQDSSGRAFLALACVRRYTQTNQFYARALSRDGRRLSCACKSISGGTKEDSVLAERLFFDAPLNDLAYFTLGTRDVETMEWTNVALPPR
jgi:serine/threonine protein kinase